MGFRVISMGPLIGGAVCTNCIKKLPIHIAAFAGQDFTLY